MTSPTTCDRINTLGRYNLETKIRLLKEGYKNHKKSIAVFCFAYKNAAHCIGKQTKIMFFYDQQLGQLFFYPKIVENYSKLFEK